MVTNHDNLIVSIPEIIVFNLTI